MKEVRATVTLRLAQPERFTLTDDDFRRIIEETMAEVLGGAPARCGVFVTVTVTSTVVPD